MTISSAFLWRFLDDVWDLLPTQDRKLFETYWKAQIQIGAGFEQRILELTQSQRIMGVPVHLTERWNRFVLNEDNCDLFSQSDSLTLTLTAPAPLSRETALYDTLRVSTPSGQVYHEETIQLFDNSVRELAYGDILPNRISVWLGPVEYTLNRDYVINFEKGTIQPLDTGRIPPTEILTVRYWHAYYVQDRDYVVNVSNATIARTAGSKIASGDTVAVSYTYNGTPTLAMEGTTGSVAISTLTDENKNFSSLLPGRKLTITSGPNAGVYTIHAVPTPRTIQVVELFPVIQEGTVTYSINAFPHGIRVSSAIASIPVLQNLVDDPTVVMIQNIDYRVADGILSVRSAFPMGQLGPDESRQRKMWAEVTRVNAETPYRNFGVLIDFYRPNSEEYKLALQGLWYAFWTGSTPNNLQRGMHILLGLPFARSAGTVVQLTATQMSIRDESGRTLTYGIPSGLVPQFALGDAVNRFDSLTDGVRIIDRNNQPGFVSTHLGRAGISKYLTSLATQGVGNTDETKALSLLEHHLFLPQILTQAITRSINVAEIKTFLDNMKPQWTDYVFSFSVDESETVSLSEQLPPNQLAMDLTTTVSSNQWNQSLKFNSFLVNSSLGNVPATGTQATGNFLDYSVDWISLGVDAGDTLIIGSGLFKGTHVVLKRFSSSLISIDIPDASIASATGIPYVVIPIERNLDNDMIQFRFEHLVLPGISYSAPTLLNTKSDAIDPAPGWTVNDIKSLLLVDISNAGFEIQPITAFDVPTQELDVASPPAVAVQPHEIASCALLRTNNTLAVVTHAYAI